MAVLLSLQLFALTQHDHELNSQSDHCPACHLANNFTGGASIATPVLLITVLFLAYQIIRLSARASYPPLHRHLRPLSQAPPAA